MDDDEMSIKNLEDIRWQQRLANYGRALEQLTAAVDLGGHENDALGNYQKTGRRGVGDR